MMSQVTAKWGYVVVWEFRAAAGADACFKLTGRAVSGLACLPPAKDLSRRS